MMVLNNTPGTKKTMLMLGALMTYTARLSLSAGNMQLLPDIQCVVNKRGTCSSDYQKGKTQIVYMTKQAVLPSPINIKSLSLGSSE